MRPSPEYIISAFFILTGLLTIIFKPNYDPDERINLKKYSIYQGLAVIGFGIYLILFKWLSAMFKVPFWWLSIALVIGVSVLIIAILRLRKVCNFKEDWEIEAFNRNIYKRRAKIAKKIALIFVFFVLINFFLA